MTIGKNKALTRGTFVGKAMSLLFNMLARVVIIFLPRSKHLLISWLQSPSAAILEPKKIKPDTVSKVSHLFAMKWWDQMPWSSFSECWALSQLCHSPLSLSSRGFVLLFLPDLESNPWSFLQTSQEALLPLGHKVGSKRCPSRLKRRAESFASLRH